MSIAYYMNFTEGHHGALDRIGGLPTHLPTSFPTCLDTGEQMAFLSQFYSTRERFNLPGILCIQMYQCLGIDEGEDPHPLALLVPVGAQVNDQKSGRQQPTIVSHDI